MFFKILDSVSYCELVSFDTAVVWIYKSRVSSHENRVSSHKYQVSSQENRVSSHETRVSSHKSRVSSHETRVYSVLKHNLLVYQAIYGANGG